MANTRIIFLSTEHSELETELSCFLNSNNEIFISIEGDGVQGICLDKETCIKLVRTLKSEISKINW